MVKKEIKDQRKTWSNVQVMHGKAPADVDGLRCCPTRRQGSGDVSG